MFHFLEYPFSRGSTHIQSSDPYQAPDFDTGFMNDERDMAPMVWGYVKSRETARRMDAYAGEVATMHPFFALDSPARAHDMDLETTKRYALPGNLTAGLQHGSWSNYLPEADRKPAAGILSSNKAHVREELQYSKEDIEAVEEWTKRHVESTWHSLGVSRSQMTLKLAALLTRFRPAPWHLGKATAL
jgi:alcohol oxidase